MFEPLHTKKKEMDRDYDLEKHEAELVDFFDQVLLSYVSNVICIDESRDTHMNESCPCMNESCRTFERVTSHV